MTQGVASYRMLRLYQPRRARRTGWHEIEHHCDMATVATDMLGPSMRKCGDEQWWHCPFHEGCSPSLWVAVGASHWSCMGCGAGGNAVALVMRIKKIGFGEAIKWLCDRPGSTSSTTVFDNKNEAHGPTAGRATQVDPTPSRLLRLCWDSP
jgi:CHC2 zinc finger